MAFKAGHNSHVLMDGVAGSLVNITGYVDNVSWSQSVSQAEVSVMGTAARQFIPTLTDGDEITLSGPLDVAIGTFVTGVKAAQAAGSSTSTFTWSPLGSASGLLKITAEVNVSGFGPSAGVDGRTEYSASLQVTGSVTNATW